MEKYIEAHYKVTTTISVLNPNTDFKVFFTVEDGMHVTAEVYHKDVKLASFYCVDATKGYREDHFEWASNDHHGYEEREMRNLVENRFPHLRIYEELDRQEAYLATLPRNK